ncbi:MAG: HPr family phosphocarrier protein [Thermodesulfobacteriota bacterium]
MGETAETHNHVRTRELVIKNRLGLHARAAAALVRVAQQYESDLAVEKDGQSVDAKSVLSLIGLECPWGTRVLVRARGADSGPALEAVASLIENKFGEE